MSVNNRDDNLINDFGDEWNKFNQNNISKIRNKDLFDKYFEIFPWDKINKNSVGIDVGSGSGRWSYFLANKVKKLYLIEPSLKALDVSKFNLSKFKNIEFFNKDANNIPLKDETIDFCICLGVLHHIPNIEKALRSINLKLKINAPFLLYIYYSFENKPMWFKFIWKISDLLRRIISRLPFFLKSFICDLIAIFVYFPLSRISKLINFFNFNIKNIPLSFYSDKSFYILRNDALDRFGTKIEQRLSKKEIEDLLLKTGFTNISFSKKEPYWCAICYKLNK